MPPLQNPLPQSTESSVVSRLRDVAKGLSTVALIFVTFSPMSGETQQFGGELSDAKVVDLVEVMDNAEDYVDQNIKITGRVEAVCPMKGCWVEVEKPEANVSLRVKVEDDVVVFPAEAKGKSIVAEGILRKIELNEKQTRAWLKHAAEERGEEFDASSVIEPMILYQIEGLAAEIDDLTPSIEDHATSISDDE